MSYSDRKPDLDAFLGDNGDDRLSATAGKEVETREEIRDVFRENESRGTRIRTLTEKGLIYQLEVKYRKRDDALRQLQAESESIRSLFIEKELMFSHWLTLYEHVLMHLKNIICCLLTRTRIEMIGLNHTMSNFRL